MKHLMWALALAACTVGIIGCGSGEDADVENNGGDRSGNGMDLGASASDPIDDQVYAEIGLPRYPNAVADLGEWRMQVSDGEKVTLYLKTDDCQGLYDRCIAAGAESVSAPERLEHWPVTAAFVLDPDGYTVEILEHHADAAALSGPAAGEDRPKYGDVD